MLKRVIVLIILSLLTLPLSAETKRALVIGLGRQEDPSWSKVHGDKDTELVKTMLSARGFEDIDLIVDSSATKAGIVDRFERLLARCTEGDVIYIHYSGHGQQMTDLDGDEDDGWDECWIPYDAYLNFGEKDNGEKHLTDDEIASFLQAIRTAIGPEGIIAVVVDACHSGDSTRGEQLEHTPRGVFTKFILPLDKNRKKAEPVEEDWLTLSACRSYQVNFEHPSGYGKLTYLICSNIDRLQGMGNEEFIAALDALMQKNENRGKYPQSPVLSGNLKKYRFTNVLQLICNENEI